MSFRPVDNFSQNSYKSACPITGLPKQQKSLGIAGDSMVLRGPEIKFYDGRGEVSLGYFDIRPQAVIEAAANHLGMIEGPVYDALHERLDEYIKQADAHKAQSDSYKAQAQAMILSNAELITQNEALRAELESCYEDLYSPEDAGA